jgi:hypothetical protein
MAPPTFSPDGKFMWTGSEWIPAPPGSTQTANVNLQDSVVGGDVNITQNHNQETLTCPNCGTKGSVQLLACIGIKPYPDCKQIDYCSFCIDSVVSSRVRLMGYDVGDPMYTRLFKNHVKCNRCWRIQWMKS